MCLQLWGVQLVVRVAPHSNLLHHLKPLRVLRLRGALAIHLLSAKQLSDPTALRAERQ